jgi:hypothetical protein
MQLVKIFLNNASGLISYKCNELLLQLPWRFLL